MKFISLCEQYKEALGAKDLAAVQELFTEDAVISAPMMVESGEI
jgi:ketosteroid isomerase-like protein